MTTLAVDASKYTVPVTPSVIQRWRDAGVGLVIIQAHPSGYGQGSSLQIMRACAAEGMRFDAYIFQYMGAPDWQEGALATLDLAAAEGLVPRQLWLDVEDVDTEKGWSAEMRREALRRDLALCDAWTEAHGVARSGLYSALWYWPLKMGNSTEWADRELWDADYDDNADTTYGFVSYGGWTLERRRVKQYAGSQPDGTDLDVLSVEEDAELANGGEPPVDDTERAEMQAKIDSLVNSLGYISGDVLRPLTRKNAAAYVKTAVAKIREQADQQGISHA